MSGSEAVAPNASLKLPSSSRSHHNVGSPGWPVVTVSETSSSGPGDGGVAEIVAVGMRLRIRR